ncbi:hypothetical protein R3P38DRAFT_880668 [Favolaschia claudopus]|uniref:Uncharacterized protein n=1 Tax=Favolaschia claudopus TaxID=2862362 RepID=A0AAW0BU46_9AGAR
MSFVYVNLQVARDNASRYTDQRGHPIQLTDNDKYYLEVKFRDLNFKRSLNTGTLGICELLVRVNGTVYRFTKPDMSPGPHAEERLATSNLGRESAGSYWIGIEAMFISHEPCHTNHYDGHECRAYFIDGRVTHRDGRTISVRFYPKLYTSISSYTPIFIYQNQARAGVRQTPFTWANYFVGTLSQNVGARLSRLEERHEEVLRELRRQVMTHLSNQAPTHPHVTGLGESQ